MAIFGGYRSACFKSRTRRKRNAFSPFIERLVSGLQTPLMAMLNDRFGNLRISSLGPLLI